MNKDKLSGECANGSFFWATDMIIVDEITEKCLLNTISYLIEDDPNIIDSIFSIV